MNRRMIFYILGIVLLIEAALMVIPVAAGLIYHEKSVVWFLTAMAISLVCGALLRLLKPKDTVFYLKEGCVATAMSWLCMSLIGALPFTLSGQIPSYVDALFETVSGFTTTGASILADVEALDHCMLLWRSFTHWIGGMGILVFLLAIISMSGGSNMNLMRAESPGPSVGKLVPKVRHTASILYRIYIALTVLMFIILVIFRMPVFDALCTAFGTAGTGGFGIKADSMASYSPALQWIITIFMILFGVNFNFYYFLLFKKWRQALKMEEVRWYFIIILFAVTMITGNILRLGGGVAKSIRDAAFQVASIITTTGFATVDFDLWPNFSRTLLVVIMFIGACAGSTGGGIKVSRFIAVIKAVGSELYFYVHPKSVRQTRLEGKTLDSDTMRSISSYFILFLLVFVASACLVSLDNYDLTTNFTAVAATLNNIGPGLNLVGPTQNFALFSDFSKFVLMFDMLAGRLELYPMILLFYPAVWKNTLTKRQRGE
ncbi:MAG: TrkH family potassium uptake protein [Oscillospiraceae bacterium]|nr:TrkH family potassium uptake protein [Oscillospiraceae bacterium]